GLGAALQGVPPADSLRRALGEVFARPEYAWGTGEGRGPFDWLRELWFRLLDWIGTMQSAHPAGFKLLLAALIAVLAGLVLHVGYVVWRITRPTTRSAAGAVQSGGGLRLEDARAHRERADELARAGRYAEAPAHRFVALLLEVERRNAFSLHPAKPPAGAVGRGGGGVCGFGWGRGGGGGRGGGAGGAGGGGPLPSCWCSSGHGSCTPPSSARWCGSYGRAVAWWPPAGAEVSRTVWAGAR